MKGEISVKSTDNTKRRNKNLTFKVYAIFRSCISKINKTFVCNAKDFDVAMPMYNLLEYNDNYSMTLGSLQNYYKDEVNDDANENNDAGSCRINNIKIIISKLFEYKGRITGKMSGNNRRLNAEVALPLKHFSNFCKFFNLLLINCEITVTRNIIVWKLSAG